MIGKTWERLEGGEGKVKWDYILSKRRKSKGILRFCPASERRKSDLTASSIVGTVLGLGENFRMKKYNISH